MTPNVRKKLVIPKNFEKSYKYEQVTDIFNYKYL
jgi:hypothetical protein